MSRRTLGTLAMIAVFGVFLGLIISSSDVRRLALPLSDASVIREQAAEQAPRPGADRRGDLRRDEVRSAPLAGGGAGADADPARHRLLPRAALGWVTLHRERPGDAEHQRRLRQLLPALPARSLRRQRDAGGRRVQRRARRTSTAGSRMRTPRDGSSPWARSPSRKRAPTCCRVRLGGPARLPRHLPRRARAVVRRIRQTRQRSPRRALCLAAGCQMMVRGENSITILRAALLLDSAPTHGHVLVQSVHERRLTIKASSSGFHQRVISGGSVSVKTSAGWA